MRLFRDTSWLAFALLVAIPPAAVVLGPVPARAQPAESPAQPGAPTAAPAGFRVERRPFAGQTEALTQALAGARHADAIALLLALESRWAMDPAYNALLAEVALAARRYPDASLALERLVLLEPGNAGAWLDLAVSSEAMGDIEGARRALAALERDFDPPAGIRMVIAAMRARMAAASAAPTAGRLTAGLFYGRDSNANGGLSTGSLTLTQAGLSIELPLDPTYRPRSSSLWQANVDGTGQWQTDWGVFEGRIALAEKRRSAAPEFDTRDLLLAAAGAVPSVSDAYWMLEWRRLEMSHSPLVDVARLRVSHDFATGFFGCRPGIGLEAEHRSYRADLRAYDARITWVDASVRCSLWGGQWVGLLRWGDDRGPADRPGGDARRNELAVLWQGQLAPRWALAAGVTLAQGRDAQGYSPLIQNGQARAIDRAAVRGELAWRLAGGWHAVAWAERIHQASNLGLFGLDQTVLMTGLRFQP